MPDKSEQELAEIIAMLFNTTIEQGRRLALRPNALLLAPPKDVIGSPEEMKVQQTFSKGVKLRMLLRAFSTGAPTPGDASSAAVTDSILWSFVGGYCWARDNDLSPLTQVLMSANPFVDGLDKWSAEECKVIASTAVSTICRTLGEPPTKVDLSSVVASMAPFGGWSSGKKMLQFEKDGDLLKALLDEGGHA